MEFRAELALVDTDVWSHLYGVKKRPHSDRARWESALIGRTTVIAVQTRAEVLVWAHSRLSGARRDSILAALDATTMVPIDEAIIQRFVRLTVDARARGDALGQNDHTGDRWVAATALALNAPLIAIDGIYNSDPGLLRLADLEEREVD